MTTSGRRFFDIAGATLILLLFGHLSTFHGLELGDQCFQPLGLESGRIQDAALTASSSYDSGSVGPHHARLRNNKQGGAWCPRHMVSRNSREYLEIDLGKLHVITGTKTQGRYGNGQGQEYAEQYMVEYWRPGLQKWVRWKDRSGKELLSGNSDTFTIVEQTLDPPAISSKLRILPYSDHVRTACMRIELSGCPWIDGLQSYSMPQGVKKTDLDLSDRSYDGLDENGQLLHGLGQLTDGVKGQDNFRLDIKGLGKGYEWIGWRNDTPGWAGLPLEILFEFDRVRNFSAAHLYTNNWFTKDVQVFSHARIFFSLDGLKFSPEPVHFSYMPDLVMEHSRNVTIKLHQRIGRFMKLQLYFASRWILLSEVSFESGLLIGNFTTEAELAATLPDFTEREYAIQGDEVQTASKNSGRNISRVNASGQNPAQIKSKGYIGILIAILTAIILCLAAAIVLIVLKSQKSRAALTSDNEKIAVDEQLKSGAAPQAMPPSPAFSNYADIPDLVSKSRPTVGEEGAALFLTDPPPVPPPPQNYYSREEISGLISHSGYVLRSSSRSRLMLPLSPHMGAVESKVDTFSIRKISSEKLRVMEKVGKGHFGDVHLCETTGTPLSVKGEATLCVLYTLEDATALEAFKREVNQLARLHDENVAIVLGASLQEPSYYAVRQYAHLGDLCQFLQDHVAESTSAVASNARILSYGCLIYMATQLASGMKHLEQMQVLHKDLAARNCLVDLNYQVKISDLGCYRDAYSQDYCHCRGKHPLPLRWMSWESALLGTYSSKSDVWSFAVLLWEILTFAREQPFEYLPDERLLENFSHHYQNDGQQMYLNVPHICPKEIYDLMMECWNRNESDRPTFREIHLFLQRKNLGFSAQIH
ncbi:discoidin domain-containing receptor 2 isoform X1 [Dendroctonus ponderosae]|uniref:Protein kinase domain-containing protein n=1 Tax=Dendroctonus ponderosae TaxID=77166 RepID=A0AAR5PZH9_DENPD|nr:discoidin domain-containing receptor 2 isoform X1 [Dendroctonus ponderosae]KAH1008410.1 hypothetical protein HUJ05_008964 [Dendroctonus ponderosae]